MVDPNPARGMPAALQRYWLAGKGAAKIRWHMPHDFDRCVRNLRKYFPKNPQGLCNILHQKAVGAPPGKGHGHSLTASMVTSDDPKYLVAAQALIDKQPELGQYTWASPMAPIGLPTGEPRRIRVFEPGSLSHRVMPRPLDWRKEQAQGHTGGVTVGRMLGFGVGPDHAGQDWAYAWGDFLNEDIVPEAKRARYLVEMGVAGPSLDPGGRVEVAINPENGTEHYNQFVVGGSTLVSIPAYADLGMHVFDGDADWPDDDDMPWSMEDDEDCGCGEPKAITASINSHGWKGKPLAVRETVFDNDDAIKRITAWANGDANKMREAFLYHDDRGNPLDTTSYRMPIGDIINGKLTLIFHAIYAAAALLSGAHGGLPNVPEKDIEGARNVISEIYAIMAREFGDNNIRAPWDRSGAPGVQLSMDSYAAAEPYGEVQYADPGYRDSKKRYPIDTPEHIRAAWSYINQQQNAGQYTSDQLKQIKARIVAAAKKAGVQISEDSMSMTYPVNPPKAWFENPGLSGKTKLTVTDEGHVFGHLAAWNECHRDVTNRECVMAPRSRHGYEPFHLGTVVTREGDTLNVGKIIMDTRHAAINLGYTATAIHYDNTGDEVAVIRCGEDDFGIWFSGAIVPEATPQKVAKLRRSPLSGDWRRERGALELTAALAVNAPAFPIYSMDNDEVQALTAAGSVWFTDDEPAPYQPPPTGIVMDAIKREVALHFAATDEPKPDTDRDELAARLKDLEEDEEIYAQRQRAERLQHMFSMDPGPVPGAAPAPAPGGAAPVLAGPPVPGQPTPAIPRAADPATPGAAGESATDAAGMDVDAWNIAAQASARYRVVRDLRDKSAESADAANPATPDTPAPAGPPATAPPTY
jgi:hypothetical protein